MITKEIKCLAEALLQEGLENEKIPSDVMELIEQLREEIFTEWNREMGEPEPIEENDLSEKETDFSKNVEQDWSELEENFKEWSKCCEPIMFESEPVYDVADLVLLDTYVLGQKDMAKTVHKEIQSLIYDRFKPLDEADDS